MSVTGSCLCGAVAFEVTQPLAPAAACHCSQCRRQSGHYWASADAPGEALRLLRDEGLRWFDSSPGVRRGFCGTCGSFLFWQKQDSGTVSVAMGALAAPTGTRLARHIFVADKGDYYDIDDTLPQRD